MSKRSAEEPLPEEMNVKKQKTVDATNDAVPASVPENVRPNIPENSAVTETEAAAPATNNGEVALGDKTVAGPAEVLATGAKATGGNVPLDNGKPAKTPKKTPSKASTSKAKAGKVTTPAKVAKTPKKPPVANGFLDFEYDKTVPGSNDFWGIKPLPGSQRPHSDQPSARESNGQTNPPMWEDRGYRYKRGNRYVKYFGPIAPDNVDTLQPTLDQEDLLVVKVIDMRARSTKDLTSKRTPRIYCYGKVPRDWNHMQSIKALNDRRYQAIDRMTLDAPWTRIEREYLASLLAENPNASIWELTELHNDRFMNKDYTTDTGFDFAKLSVGRTVESVRYEYCTYKPVYDKGQAPEMIRWRGDPSTEAKDVKNSQRPEKFGPPSKALQMAHDAAQAGEDDDLDSDSNEDSPKKLTNKDKGKRLAEDDSEEDERPIKKVKTVRRVEADPFAGQAKLNDEDEELLKLAGAYETDEEPSQASLISMLPLALVSSLASPPASPKNKSEGKPVENVTEQIVETVVSKAPQQESIVEDPSVEKFEEVEKTVAQENTVEEVTKEQSVAAQTLVQTQTADTTRQNTTTRAARPVFIDDNYDDDDDEL